MHTCMYSLSQTHKHTCRCIFDILWAAAASVGRSLSVIYTISVQLCFWPSALAAKNWSWMKCGKNCTWYGNRAQGAEHSARREGQETETGRMKFETLLQTNELENCKQRLSYRCPELLSTLCCTANLRKAVGQNIDKPYSFNLTVNLTVKCNANSSGNKGASLTCGHILHWYLRPLPPAGACPPPAPTPGPPILLALIGWGTTSSAAADAAATALLWWCAAAAAAAEAWLPWCEPPPRPELPPPGPGPEPLTALPSPRLPVEKID